MSKLCEIFTAYGHKCPNIATGYDPNFGKSGCGKHLPVCRRLYKEYKDICNDSDRCVDGMSKAELNATRKTLDECIKRRVLFSAHCCDGVIDQGHAEYLVGKGRRRAYCDRLLDEHKQRQKQRKK